MKTDNIKTTWSDAPNIDPLAEIKAAFAAGKRVEFNPFFGSRRWILVDEGHTWHFAVNRSGELCNVSPYTGIAPTHLIP